MKKKVSDSAVEMLHAPMPNEMNATGNIHGGHIFYRIDNAGGVCARRHARSNVVTACIDHMDYISSIRPGENMILKASINYAGRTSMDIGVRVDVEAVTGEIRHAATCYLTYIAIDHNLRPIEIPALDYESEDDLRRRDKALRRRELRGVFSNRN